MHWIERIESAMRGTRCSENGISLGGDPAMNLLMLAHQMNAEIIHLKEQLHECASRFEDLADHIDRGKSPDPGFMRASAERYYVEAGGRRVEVAIPARAKPIVYDQKIEDSESNQRLDRARKLTKARRAKAQNK